VSAAARKTALLDQYDSQNVIGNNSFIVIPVLQPIFSVDTIRMDMGRKVPIEVAVVSAQVRTGESANIMLASHDGEYQSLKKHPLD
jgi:hypothetical protein